MTERHSTSFAHVSFLEAVARRSRVDLILRPGDSDNPSRLSSRLLGFQGDDLLAMEIPKLNDHKVFVSPQEQIGMAFSVGPFFLQATTTVVSACQYPLRADQRVDALLVERPGKIIAADRRERPRNRTTPDVCVMVSLWPSLTLATRQPPMPSWGRLLDYSQNGLGIRLEAPLPYEVGTEMILRFEQDKADEFPISRAILKHQTKENGFWVAGFGDVCELAPGEAHMVIEAIAVRG